MVRDAPTAGARLVPKLRKIATHRCPTQLCPICAIGGGHDWNTDRLWKVDEQRATEMVEQMTLLRRDWGLDMPLKASANTAGPLPISHQPRVLLLLADEPCLSTQGDSRVQRDGEN